MKKLLYWIGYFLGYVDGYIKGRRLRQAFNELKIPDDDRGRVLVNFMFLTKIVAHIEEHFDLTPGSSKVFKELQALSKGELKDIETIKALIECARSNRPRIAIYNRMVMKGDMSTSQIEQYQNVPSAWKFDVWLNTGRDS